MIYLTPAEQRILVLLSEGLTIEQVAAKFGHKSKNTMKKHVRVIRDKLEAENITNAVAKAIRQNLI